MLSDDRATLDDCQTCLMLGRADSRVDYASGRRNIWVNRRVSLRMLGSKAECARWAVDDGEVLDLI